MGPIISTTWQALSPVYYFILTPIMVLTNYNYLAQNYFTVFLDTLKLTSIYVVLYKLHGVKAGIVGATLYGFNWIIITGSSICLNPVFVPFFHSSVLLLIL